MKIQKHTTSSQRSKNWTRLRSCFLPFVCWCQYICVCAFVVRPWCLLLLFLASIIYERVWSASSRLQFLRESRVGYRNWKNYDQVSSSHELHVYIYNKIAQHHIAFVLHVKFLFFPFLVWWMHIIKSTSFSLFPFSLNLHSWRERNRK